MTETIIFCESYPQIKNTLYLAKQRFESTTTTVAITGMSSLLKFFNLINERAFHNRLKIVYFDIYRGPSTTDDSKLTKILNLIPDILKERKRLRSVFEQRFANVKDAEVFFFSRYFNPTTYYLLRRLDRNNRLVFMPEPSYDALAMKNTIPENVSEAVYLVRSKAVYGWGIRLSKHPVGQKTTQMPDSFLSSRSIKTIPKRDRDNQLSTFSLKEFGILPDKKYSVMYFHEDLVEHDYISNPAAYEDTITEVFRVISKYFPPDEVAVKYHPASGDEKMSLPFGDVLPDFIPAEFLYDDKVKVYLGVSTQALANAENGISISLIDLVSFKNGIIGTSLKKALVDWQRTEIRFPKSIDEFEEILAVIR